jgi:hypothetical protein
MKNLFEANIVGKFYRNNAKYNLFPDTKSPGSTGFKIYAAGLTA